MLVPVDFFHAELTRPMRPADDTISISCAAIKDLIETVGEGNHTYLTLEQYNYAEVVRFDYLGPYDTLTDKTRLPVQREVGGYVRKTFPVNACVGFRWEAISLEEFIKQVQENTDDVLSNV